MPFILKRNKRSVLLAAQAACGNYNGDDSRSYLRTAYSALHFEPVREDVEWRMVFHTKQFEEESFSLLEEEFCVFFTETDSPEERFDADV